MVKIEPAGQGDREPILQVMKFWNMHHVPSREMEELNLRNFFVAKVDGKIVGASGFKMIRSDVGKTTLLSVDPSYNGMGIGQKLQDARLLAMHKWGAKSVITNADRPETISWYMKHYGYFDTGLRVPKVHSFGDDSIDHWTTIEMDLEKWVKERDEKFRKADYTSRNFPHPLAPYPPLLINVCLTGMIPTKDMTKYVPITPEEIAEDAVKVYDAGARIVHLHARDNSGKPIPDAKVYGKMISLIRKERPKLICCISTSGRNWPEFERRSEALYLTGDEKPDMASLTLGSLNFPTGPSVNSIEMIRRLAETMNENGIRPELEVFDTGMISLAKSMERNGVLVGRKYFNLLLGNINTTAASVKNLTSLVDELPENSTWAAAGIGQFQLPMNAASIIMGGNVRVGLEDNIYYGYDKKELASNVVLVERLKRIAEEIYRPLATPEEARDMAGII